MQYLEDVLIPITLFLVIAACIIVPFYLRYKTRVHKMETVVKLAASGGEVKAEMIRMLGQEGGPQSDLRKGLIYLAIAIPVLLGLLIQKQYAIAVILGGVPLCVGLAYLIVMKYGYTHDSLKEPDTLG
jgi:hypothetical protein